RLYLLPLPQGKTCLLFPAGRSARLRPPVDPDNEGSWNPRTGELLFAWGLHPRERRDELCAVRLRDGLLRRALPSAFNGRWSPDGNQIAGMTGRLAATASHLPSAGGIYHIETARAQGGERRTLV